MNKIIYALPIIFTLTIFSSLAESKYPPTPDELEKIRMFDANLGNYGVRTIISGPATIKLNDIAKLNLSKNYIYIEDKKNYATPLSNAPEENCSRYILLRNPNRRVLCIKIFNVGYLRLSNNLSNLQKKAKELQNNILPEYLRNIPKDVNFSWLELPEYNKHDHTLSWTYRYTFTNKNHITPVNHTEQESSVIIFGKQHIIWLTNYDFHKKDEFLSHLNDWGKKIVFAEDYQYQQGNVPACHGLAPGDSALEGIAYDYSANPQRCFPYPIETLITGLPEKTRGNLNIYNFMKKIWMS